jgi:hypothetical protein
LIEIKTRSEGERELAKNQMARTGTWSDILGPAVWSDEVTAPLLIHGELAVHYLLLSVQGLIFQDAKGSEETLGRVGLDWAMVLVLGLGLGGTSLNSRTHFLSMHERSPYSLA